MRNSRPLHQDLLNVANKSRSNMFSWRGQFTPQLVEYLLGEFASAKDVVLDPFCGSGTLLLECAAKNISAAGFEINPAACAMSKFFTFCNTSLRERQDIASSLVQSVNKRSAGLQDLPLFEPQCADSRHRYAHLLDFAEDLLSDIHDKREMLLAVLLLFRAQASRTRDLFTALRRSLTTLESDLLSLPVSSARIQAFLGDARICHQRFRAKASLIITSPPYVNVFNYHQNYRAILELLGFDILKVAQSEIGSNRKNRANRFRTLVQYCIDLHQAFTSFANALTANSTLIVIMGRESRIRRIPFSNSGIVRDLLLDLGCFGNPELHERVFVNRFGNRIKEDILVAERNKGKPQPGNPRHIAVKHLEEASRMAKDDVKVNVLEAICEADLIRPSPVLKTKEII